MTSDVSDTYSANSLALKSLERQNAIRFGEYHSPGGRENSFNARLAML